MGERLDRDHEVAAGPADGQEASAGIVLRGGGDGPSPSPRRALERSQLPWLHERTILYVRHGSHAFGLNTPASDEDFKGVAIPPAEYFYGFLNRFEQAECKDPDSVVYDLRKFCALAADCNPSILEVLFTDDEDVVLCTEAGRHLRAFRHMFLSTKAKHTYSGYATQQLRRIKTHYRWLRNPMKWEPARRDYDLPERTLIPADQLAAAQSAIEKKLDGWNLSGIDDLEPSSRVLMVGKIAEVVADMGITADARWAGAARAVGMDENFIALLDRERRYGAARREWEQFQNWKATRNPARAAIEAEHGYDCKNGMHLVRLMRTCRELLTTGEVIVKRPDREELLAIRHGAWPYEKLVEWAEREDAELDALAKTCTVLPKAPDRVAIDDMCQDLVRHFLHGWDIGAFMGKAASQRGV